MQKALPDIRKNKWKYHVEKLVLAYNCTKHSASRYSTYHIMFSRRPKPHIDISLPTDEEISSHHKDYIQNCREQMKEACERTIKKERTRVKKGAK